MKNFVIFLLTITIVFEILYWFLNLPIMQDAYKNTSAPESPAMQNIADKCGILPDDALWTTAMNKISACLDKLDMNQESYVSSDEVIVDPDHNDRVMIGPDKNVDWLEVDCTVHIAAHEVIVRDWCDYGPIERIKYSPEEQMWFIFKKNSEWGLFIDRGPESAVLRLLGRR
jgi:hypothetical protein